MQIDQAVFPESVDRKKRVLMQESEVVDDHVRRSPEWQLDNVRQKDSRVQLFSPHEQFRPELPGWKVFSPASLVPFPVLKKEGAACKDEMEVKKQLTLNLARQPFLHKVPPPDRRYWLRYQCRG